MHECIKGVTLWVHCRLTAIMEKYYTGDPFMISAFNLICNLTVVLMFLMVKNTHTNSPFATLHFSKDSGTQIVRDENKNSSFVTTNLNSFVCTSVPRVDFLCMWQLCVPVFSLPGLLINVWRWNLRSSNLQRKGSALLKKCKCLGTCSSICRKHVNFLTCLQLYLGNCRADNSSCSSF